MLCRTRLVIIAASRNRISTERIVQVIVNNRLNKNGLFNLDNVIVFMLANFNSYYMITSIKSLTTKAKLCNTGAIS